MTMRTPCGLLLGLSMALALPPAAAAPFGGFNQASPARAAALPSMGAGAPLADGEVDSRVTLDWSNEFFFRGDARETLLLDSESQRLAFAYRRGFAGWEGWLELPLLFTGGGVLDSGIEGWHSTFGLPNSNRARRPQDEYRLRYVRDGAVVFDLAEGTSGLADVRLGAGRALTERLTAHAMLQLPTGDADRFTGGHAGVALWADYRLPLGDSPRAALTLSAGASASTRDGPLADLQEPLVLLGGAVLSLPVYGALDGIVQVNGHSGLYKNTNMAALSRAAAPTSFGFRWPWRQMVVDLAVTEDLSVNASPDFGLWFGLAWRGR